MPSKNPRKPPKPARAGKKKVKSVKAWAFLWNGSGEPYFRVCDVRPSRAHIDIEHADNIRCDRGKPIPVTITPKPR